MLSKVYSAGLSGTEGFIVRCETDVGEGLPGINMIGLLSSEVRESQERVKTAVRNSGFYFKTEKVTVNLAPADVRKEGCGYDAAIAVGFLISHGIIDSEKSSELINNSVFIGELSLSGELLGVRGMLSLVCAAKDSGFKNIFVPEANATEAAVISGINCYPVKSITELADILNGDISLPEKAVYSEKTDEYEYERDFSDICGQEMVKRATVVAVAGRHNMLLIGPAGTGKSMIASRIPTIMPRMSYEERLRVSKLYSVCGLLDPGEPLLNERPFRSPHHTITPNALSGGGSNPKPGEISLATDGVLFLDELAEFKSQTIETLRQPMEDKKVVISRIHSSVEYPADFVLCAATNPCKCGYYPDRSKCRCTPLQVKSYLGKISKPILDRIDICVETAIPCYADLTLKKSGEKSSEIRKKVEYVRAIQAQRLSSGGIYFNSEMSTGQIEEYCVLSKNDDVFLKEIYEKKNMSARGLHKVLKVARTIADLEGHKNIEHDDICEAVSYRLQEERYWGGGGRYEEAYVSRQVR